MSQTAGPSTPSPRRTAPRRSLNPYASDAPSASPHRGSVPAASPLRRVVVAASEDGTPSKRRRVEGAAESSHQNRPSVTQQEQAQGDRTDVALDALKARRQSRGSVGSASRSSVGGRRKSRGSTGGTVDTSRYNDRVDALNKAVDKFLELIDEAATPENFSTTLPQVPLETLDPIRLKFISDLKADIKAQHIEIAEDFNLEEKLRELQRLTEEADARAAAGESNRGDIWKEELDIGNALDAKGVEIQSENVAKMTRELEQTRKVNAQLYEELQANMAESTAQQNEAATLLDAVGRAVEAIKEGDVGQRSAAESLQAQVKGALLALSDELGPRAL